MRLNRKFTAVGLCLLILVLILVLVTVVLRSPSRMDEAVFDAVDPTDMPSTTPAVSSAVPELSGAEQEFMTLMTRLRALGGEQATVYRDLGAAKNRAPKEDPEIGALAEAFRTKRRHLAELLNALPGMAARVSKRDALKRQRLSLMAERRAVQAGLSKTPDDRGLLNQRLVLDDRLADVHAQGERVTGEMEAIKKRARNSDPEIKPLTAMLIEIQHELAAKINLFEPVARLRQRIDEFDAEAEELQERLTALQRELSGDAGVGDAIDQSEKSTNEGERPDPGAG